MKRTTLEALNRARRQGRPIVRVVDLATADERLFEPGAETSAMGMAATAAARADRSGPLEIDGSNCLLDVHNPPLDMVDHRRRAYRAGAGADGRAGRLSRAHHRSAHGLCDGSALPRRHAQP